MKPSQLDNVAAAITYIVIFTAAAYIGWQIIRAYTGPPADDIRPAYVLAQSGPPRRAMPDIEDHKAANCGPTE